MWGRKISSKQDLNFQNSNFDSEETRNLKNSRKSEEEEKSLDIETEKIYPVSIFFVDIHSLVNFLISEGFYIDSLSLRFRDAFGQGTKTYYSISPQVVLKIVNSNKIFDLVEIVLSKFFERIQVKISLNSIIIRNGTASLYDGIKKFIRHF